MVLKVCYYLYCQIIQRPTAENKQKLATLSKNVAATMTEIIQAAEAIKGRSPAFILSSLSPCDSALCFVDEFDKLTHKFVNYQLTVVNIVTLSCVWWCSALNYLPLFLSFVVIVNAAVNVSTSQ